MNLFLSSIAIALAFEGIVFALFPDMLRRAMLELSARSNEHIRFMGVSALVCVILMGMAIRALYG